MTESRYSRQILAFGEEGQRKLTACRVGIVGLGGLGSHVAQSLAYLGVGVIVLIDDDVVEATNLNRLVGGTPEDAERRRLKVDVASRLIQQVNPDANIYARPDNLRSRAVLELLTECDIIFGCVDNDAARLILTELSTAYEIVLIDCATEIFVETDHLEYGGRVVFARPGDFCLLCARQLDKERAAWELKSPIEREVLDAHGYGLGDDVPAPAVISLNGVIANLAVTEFMLSVAGIREPERMLHYQGSRGIVTASRDKRSEDCYICGYLRGQRENAGVIERYTKDSDA
jgi:hypothetical protein